MTGGVGEKSVRSILEDARRIADLALPDDREAIRKMAGDIGAMVDALVELRDDGKGGTPQAHSLGRAVNSKLKELSGLVNRAIGNIERTGTQGPAHTITGKFDQASKWLSNLAFDDKGVGQQAVKAILQDSRRIGQSCPPSQREDIYDLCNDVEQLHRQLDDLCRRGMANTPQAQEVSRRLNRKLQELKKLIERALITRVVDDFIDIFTPLKQFTEAVYAPEGTPNREDRFRGRIYSLLNLKIYYII